MLTPFEGFVKDLSGTLSAMPMSSFLSSDMTTGPYLLAAPTKKSNKLTPLLRHYLGCKMSPARKTETFPALCVLVQKTHPLFMKQWQPMLLQHMREYPCPIPGYAFWHDNGTKPSPDKAKTNVIGSSVVPAMMFAGSACGEQATILIDSGATHCFIDQTFVEVNGIKQSPFDSEVIVADGSTLTSTTQARVYLEIQGYKVLVTCIVMNMQGQPFGVILGDTWSQAADAVVAFKAKTCVVRKGTQRHVLHAMALDKSPDQPSHATPLLLNAVRIKRSIRQGAKAFMVRVQDSGVLQAEAHPQLSPQIRSLIEEYQDVFSPIKRLPPVRDIGHTIPTEAGAGPPFRPMFRLSPKELAEVEQLVADLLKNGLIEPSSSPYGAPFLFVNLV
jgi:hypothetical protein